MAGSRRSTDQVSERRDHLQTRYPIFEVLPKREAMFAARFLETGKGIATSSPCLAASARTDLAFLHRIAQVILAAVVV